MGEEGWEQQPILPSYFLDPVDVPEGAQNDELWYNTDEWLQIVFQRAEPDPKFLTEEQRRHSVVIFTERDFYGAKASAIRDRDLERERNKQLAPADQGLVMQDVQPEKDAAAERAAPLPEKGKKPNGMVPSALAT